MAVWVGQHGWVNKETKTKKRVVLEWKKKKRRRRRRKSQGHDLQRRKKETQESTKRMTKERKDENGGRWESGGCHSVGVFFFFFFLFLFLFFYFFFLPRNAAIGPPFKIFFIWLYIVGHPFKKYILFGWTYKNAAIAPQLNFFFFFIQLYIVGHTFKKYICYLAGPIAVFLKTRL